MLNYIRTTLLSALLIMTLNISYANNSSLSEEQQLLLSSSVRQSVENFEVFRSTLDVFQVGILYSPYLDGQAKAQALVSSLTLEQTALLEAHRVLDKSMKDKFESSLATDQRNDLKNHLNGSLSREEKALLEANKVLRQEFEENFESNSDDFHIDLSL